MNQLIHVLFAAFLSGCGGASAVSPAVDPKLEGRLGTAMHRRDTLGQKFRDVPQAIREQCEISAGDCLIELRDRRSTLLATYDNRLESCPPSNDPDLRLRCAARSPPAPDPSRPAPTADPTREFALYYEQEVACIEALLECSVSAKDHAKLVAHQARKDLRRSDLESTEKAVAARSMVSLVEDQIKYVRLTFPVPTQELCVPKDTVATCVEQAQEYLEAVETELNDDAGFDATKALESYEKGNLKEAECHAPELKCLIAKLSDFGATPETQQLLRRNLASLEEGQRLASHVSKTVAERCRREAKAAHQEKILQRYRDYVDQPKLYFRFQLDRAFLDLHTAQVVCLKSHSKSGKSR